MASFIYSQSEGRQMKLRKLYYGLIPVVGSAIAIPGVVLSVKQSNEIINKTTKFNNVQTVLVARSTPRDAWRNFYKAINDVTTNDEYRVKYDLALGLKFINSTFYTNEIKNRALTESSDVYGVFRALQTSNEFTEDEKITIGKNLIDYLSTSTYLPDVLGKQLDSFGDINQLQLKASETANTELKVDSSSSLLVNGAMQKVVGISGHLADWKNDTLINLSNQDVLDYFLTVVSRSDKLTSLQTEINKVMSSVFVPNSPSFKNQILDIFGMIDNFLSDFVTPTTTKDSLTKLSTFEFLSTFDATSLNSDDEVFEKLISSKMGQELFPTSWNQELQQYKSATIDTLKKSLQLSFIAQLSVKVGALAGFANNSQLASSAFTGFETKGLTKEESWSVLIPFTKLLIDNSNLLTQDVQIRINPDINELKTYLNIRLSHKDVLWTKVSDGLKGYKWILGDSDWDVVPSKADLKFSSMPGQNPHTKIYSNNSDFSLTDDEHLVGTSPINTVDANVKVFYLNIGLGNGPVIETLGSGSYKVIDNNNPNDSKIQTTSETKTVDTSHEEMVGGLLEKWPSCGNGYYYPDCGKVKVPNVWVVPPHKEYVHSSYQTTVVIEHPWILKFDDSAQMIIDISKPLPTDLNANFVVSLSTGEGNQGVLGTSAFYSLDKPIFDAIKQTVEKIITDIDLLSKGQLVDGYTNFDETATTKVAIHLSDMTIGSLKMGSQGSNMKMGKISFKLSYDVIQDKHI